jgi:hypothetical protein
MDKLQRCFADFRILGADSGNMRGFGDVYRRAAAAPARLPPRGDVPEGKRKGSCFRIIGLGLCDASGLL